jgi:hypothetical protein
LQNDLAKTLAKKASNLYQKIQAGKPNLTGRTDKPKTETVSNDPGQPDDFSFCIFNRLPAQRFALPALGRAAERRPTGKMLRRRKMLGIAPESPASGARFVGCDFAVEMLCTLQYFKCCV